jgi:hypothetical protein
MRAYFVPLGAGVMLAVSAFLPWVVVNGVPKRGVPDMAALWVLALGVLSAVLAALSLITRKNSRHPLLVLGLASLGITYLSWRILPRLAREHALTVAQAFAIVEGRTVDDTPAVFAGSGLYLGLIASLVIAAFGLTIVMRRASTPYVVTDPDDDV